MEPRLSLVKRLYGACSIDAWRVLVERWLSEGWDSGGKRILNTHTYLYCLGHFIMSKYQDQDSSAYTTLVINAVAITTQ